PGTGGQYSVDVTANCMNFYGKEPSPAVTGQFAYQPNTQLDVVLVEPVDGQKYNNLDDVFIRADTNIFGNPTGLTCFFSVSSPQFNPNQKNMDSSALISQTFSGYSSVFVHDGIPNYLIGEVGETYQVAVTCIFGSQAAFSPPSISILIDDTPPQITGLTVYDKRCDDVTKQVLPLYDPGTGAVYYAKETEICVESEITEALTEIESVELEYPSSTRDITANFKNTIPGNGILITATTLNLNLREGDEEEIILRAQDTIGNAPSTFTRKIILDQTPPVIDSIIINPTGSLGTPLMKDNKYIYKVADDEPLEISVTTDEPALIKLFEFSELDASSDYVTTDFLNTLLTIGEHTYKINATDRAGNLQTSQELEIVNDHIAPRVDAVANNKPSYFEIRGQNFGVLTPTLELYFRDATGIKYGNFTTYRMFRSGPNVDQAEKLTHEWLEVVPENLGNDQYKFTLDVASDLIPNEVYWDDFHYYIAYDVMDNLTNTGGENNSNHFNFGVNEEAPQLHSASLENQYWQNPKQTLILTYNDEPTKRDQHVKINRFEVIENSFTAAAMAKVDFENYDAYLEGEVIPNEGTGRRQFTITPNTEWTCSHCIFRLEEARIVLPTGEPANSAFQFGEILFYIDKNDSEIMEIELDADTNLLYNAEDLRLNAHMTEQTLSGIRTKDDTITLLVRFKDEKIIDGRETRNLTIKLDGTPIFNGEVESDRDEDTHSVYEKTQEITLVPGTNTITVQSTDLSGRQSTTFTRTLWLDEEEPTLSNLGFVYEDNIVDLSTTELVFKTNLVDFDLTGTYTTDDDATIYLDGTSYTTDGVQPSGAFTIPNIVLDQPSIGNEQENNFDIVIEDSVENKQITPLKVIVDKLAPELILVDTTNTELDLVGGNQIYYRYLSDDINLTVKSTTEGLAGCKMYFGGLPAADMTETITNEFFYETGTLVGNYDFYIVCEDNFGNQNQLDSSLWQYTDPVITGINPVLTQTLFIHPEDFENEFDLRITPVPNTNEIKCKYDFILDEGARPKLLDSNQNPIKLTYEEMQEDDEWEQIAFLPWGGKGKNTLREIIGAGYTTNYLSVNVTCKDRSGTEIDQKVDFEIDDDFNLQFKFDYPPTHEEVNWVADKKIRTGEMFSIIVNRPDAQCSVEGTPDIALLGNPTTINDPDYKLATRYEFEQTIDSGASGRPASVALPDDAQEFTVNCQILGQPIQTKTLEFIGDNTAPDVPQLNLVQTGYNKTTQTVRFTIDNLENVLENNMNDSVIKLQADNINGGPIYQDVEYNVSPDTLNNYVFEFVFEDLIKETLTGEVEEKYNFWVQAWDDLELGPVSSNILELTYDNKSPTIDSYVIENSVQNGNIYYVGSDPTITGTVSEVDSIITFDAFTTTGTTTGNDFIITKTLIDNADIIISLRSKDALENIGEETSEIILHKDLTGPTFVDATGSLSEGTGFEVTKFKELSQLLITFEDNSGFSAGQQPVLAKAERDSADVTGETTISYYGSLDENSNGFDERIIYEIELASGFTSPSATEASQYEFEVDVKDSFGTPTTFNFKFTIDPRVPEITVETEGRTSINEFKFNISDDSNNIETSTLTIELEGNEEGITNYDYADGCVISTPVTKHECTLTTPFTQSQTVTYEIYVEDDLANSNELTGQYEHDLTPISIDESTILIEGEDSSYDILADGKTNITFEIINNEPLEEITCSYSLDTDATYQQMIDAGTSEVVTIISDNLIKFLDIFNSVGSTEGAHTLYVSCKDESGNVNESIDIPFTVDTQIPAITNVELTTVGPHQGGRSGEDFLFETGNNVLTISGTYTSNDGIIVTTEAMGQTYTHTDVVSDGQFSLTTVVLETPSSGDAKEINELILNITDSAGNVNDTLKVNITLDKEKPNLEIVETSNALVGTVGNDLVYWTIANADVNLAVEANEYLETCAIHFSGLDETLTTKPADNKFTYSLANFGGISWDFEITCTDRYDNVETLYSTLKKYTESSFDEIELRVSPLIIDSPISDNFALEVLPKRAGSYLEDQELHGIQCEYDFIGLGALSEQSQFIINKEELYDNGKWELPANLPRSDGRGGNKLNTLTNAQYIVNATCRNLRGTKVNASAKFGINTEYDANFKFISPGVNEDAVHCEDCHAARKVVGGETIIILANKGDLSCNLDGTTPLTEGVLNGDVDFPLGVEFYFTLPNTGADGSSENTLEVTCISNADISDNQPKRLYYYEDNQAPQEDPVIILPSNRFNKTTQTVTVGITNLAALTEHNLHDALFIIHAKDLSNNNEYEKEFQINITTTEITFEFNELITDDPGMDAEKEYELWAEAWDDVSNGPVSSISAPLTMYFDNLDPVLSLEYTGVEGVNSLTARNIAIRLTEESNLDVTDGITPLITLTGAQDGDGYVFTPTEYKTYILKAEPTDLTGNKGEWSNTISLTYNDEAPEFRDELPSDNAIVGGTQVDFSISVEDENGLDTSTLQAFINGTPITPIPIITTSNVGTRGIITFTQLGMAAEPYNITVYLDDMLGNQGEFEWTVNTNNDAPTQPTWTVPQYTNNKLQPVTITFNELVVIDAADAVTINGEVITVPATPATTFTFTPTVDLMGDDEEKTINVVVNAHLSGGTGVDFPFTKTFTVDTIEPVVNTFESIPQETTVDLNEITLLGTFTETNLEKIEINKSTRIYAAKTYALTSFINESIELDPEENSFSVIVYDKAGNEGTATISRYYDNTVPEINAASLQIIGVTIEQDGTWIVSVEEGETITLTGTYTSTEEVTITTDINNGVVTVPPNADTFTIVGELDGTDGAEETNTITITIDDGTHITTTTLTIINDRQAPTATLVLPELGFTNDATP
ncbi:hypothetical protein HN682_01685, partial [Candidatus Peregrinibacteria bacterium]|nr:hypothetical protein [Candidatus Peregrinibacteria bacterium]